INCTTCKAREKAVALAVRWRMVSEPRRAAGDYAMNDDPIPQVTAALHTARELLLDADAKTRGECRKRLKAIESAVMDAIGAVARQGLTVDEFRRAAGKLRSA